MTRQEKRRETCPVCESGVRTQMQIRKSRYSYMISDRIVSLFSDIAFSATVSSIGRYGGGGVQ